MSITIPQITDEVQESIKNIQNSDTSKNITETEETKKVFHCIIDNYKQLEASIVSQLALSNVCHPLSTGTSREMIWRQLFENIIPKKFVIEHSIFVIDSHLNKSKEIDLAIIDNTYTPYIFQYGKLKYVPIEAVAAVVECKSNRFDDSLKTWCESIKALKTSNDSITRMATGMMIKGIPYSAGKKGDCENHERPSNKISTQTSTRPIRIFCNFCSGNTSDKTPLDLENDFDFCLLANAATQKIELKVPDNASLQTWYEELNHYGNEENEITISELGKAEYDIKKFRIQRDGEEVSLLSLNMLLNQLLMLINNPILFPHLSYAQLFNEVYNAAII